MMPSTRGMKSLTGGLNPLASGRGLQRRPDELTASTNELHSRAEHPWRKFSGAEVERFAFRLFS